MIFKYVFMQVQPTFNIYIYFFILYNIFIHINLFIYSIHNGVMQVKKQINVAVTISDVVEACSDTTITYQITILNILDILIFSYCVYTCYRSY